MTTPPRFGFVVTYVDDLAAAKRFYTDTLGLRVEREAPTFIQFEHFALATDESMDGQRNPELYWLVSDAEAACAELGPKAPISMPLRTLPFGKVFGVRDPSGQPRYLLQLAAARPSRPLEGAGHAEAG
jgi:catechol 2,3-dioxygenase-like lactoylglutathione lyase family enzyme